MEKKQVELTKLPCFWAGVKKNHVQTQQDFSLYFFDTETVLAKVYLLQIYDGKKTDRFYGLDHDYAKIFLDYVSKVPNKGRATVVFGAHYMQFDLAALFWPMLNPKMTSLKKAPRRSHFSVLNPRCEVEIFWNRPCFASIRFKKKTVYLIDTFAFFTMSLDRALKTIGSKIKKQKKPAGLGLKVIPEKRLLRYAQNDVIGGYDVLKFVIGFHHQYKVRLCVSLPQMASRIFRHYYMKKDFTKPSPFLLRAALYSYHGGKNTLTVKPGFYECHSLDIRSAYPEAMRQLPDFEKGSWEIGQGLDFVRDRPHGIYLLSGFVKKCKWGVIFGHDFKAVSGMIEKIWTTGYEILEALRAGELEIESVKGYGYESKSCQSAFQSFVDEFYSLKETTENPGKRHFYKLILNSPSGKLIQRNEDDFGNKIAGAMFDPAIASLITGYVRAKIHSLEHKYDALHTATDGILTMTKPDPKDLVDSLGGLKAEHYGPCLILRNKLYLHYDDKGNIVKKGLHGFQGTPDQLISLCKSAEKKTYQVKRLLRWSESWHRGLPPGLPVRESRELTLDNRPRV